MGNELEKLTIPVEKRAKRDLKARQKKKWILLALGVALLIYFAIYRYYYYQVPVEVMPIQVQELGLPPVLLTAGGYIIADPQLSVSSQVSGRIESLLVKEGDEIKEGTVLAVVEAKDLKAQYDDAKKTNETAARQWSRMQSLYRDAVISKRELETSQIDASKAKAQFETAQFAYEQSQVRAPIDGTIIEIVRKAGEYLSPGITSEGEPGTTILRMGNLARMKVELDVNETDLVKLKLGGPVIVFPDAFPDHSIHGTIESISPMADRQKSVVPIKISLDMDALQETQHRGMLKPDMSARVVFLEKEMKGKVERAILIPKSAVHSPTQNPYVYVVEAEAAMVRPIKLGSDQGDQVRVISGLQAGDILILDTPRVLWDKRRVKIKE